MTTDARLVVYLPNGASQGPLPTPEKWDASMPLNDVGALTVDYGAYSPRADLLGQPLELAVETSIDGGSTWAERRNARYLYLRDGRDPTQDTGWSVSCPAYVKRLEKALIPLTGLDAQGNLTFTARTVGYILNSLFTAAQTRGAMSGMTWDFTAAADSNGVAWSGSKTVSFPGGKDFLSIVQEWADLQDIDYATNGRVIQVFVGGTLGGDKTVVPSPVSLRKGRDYTEAPFDRTWEALADVALVQGDGGATVLRTNGGAVRPWGQQETLISAAGITDSGTLQSIGDLSLALTNGPRVQYTHGILFATTGFNPWTDYEPGSYIFTDSAGGGAATAAAVARMRVTQITLSYDRGTLSGNVVLNDRFDTADLRMKRAIDAILNKATAGTSSGTPSPYGNDILPPAQVLGMTSSSTAYVGQNGIIQAQITVDWADVTTNNDGTTATDIDHYEVWRRPSGGSFALMENTVTSQSTSSPYQPGTVWEFQVRAVDAVGNRGAYSSIRSQTASADASAPGAPSAPALVAVRVSTALFDWDGLTATGTAQPSDYSYTELHISTVSGFTPVKGNAATLWQTMTTAAQPVIAGLAVASYYCRLLSVDTSGNASAPSTQVAFTIAPVQGSELAADSINGKTITGAVVQTVVNLGAAGVTGMKMENDTGGGVLKWYGGFTGETPGFLNPVTTFGYPYVLFNSGYMTGRQPGQFALRSLTSTAGGRYQNGGLMEALNTNISAANNAGGLSPGTNELYVQADQFWSCSPLADALYFASAGGVTSTGTIDFTTGSGSGVLRMAGGANISGKIGTAYVSAVGAALVFEGNRAILGVQAYNAVNPTASNTANLHVAELHSWTGGVWMEDLTSGSTTGASIGTGGRIIRTTSSLRYKDHVEPLTLDQAVKARRLVPITFTRRDEDTGVRYPGFAAEQAHDVGATEWVSYDRKGRPDGFRYGELTAAHAMLIEDLYRRVEALESGAVA